MSIIEAPEVLCIHLKRFRYDAFFMSKISRHIQFPLNNLNLSSYMKSKDQSSCNYRLFSVIVHIGGAGGGHYISYGRGSGDSEDWYEFNDTRVNRISVDDVLSSEGYVLFYQRCSNQQINPINIPDIVPHPDTCIPSPDVCYISRHWLVLRNTCHRPGPVIPYEFGCEHGGVYPGRERLSKTLAIPIRRDIYEQLQQKHGGGGPLISSLDTCELCKKLILELNERRKFEADKVTEIQNDDKTSSANLLLSKLWLKQWQDFVRCDSLEVKPPGPIDNSVLLMASQDSSGITMNKVNHYRTITLSIWEYLHGIYGGGPAVMVASKTT
jgi:ubiquitin carboxyl-terminal hydrolase 20/33